MQTNILEYLEATAPRLPDKIAYSDGTDNLTFAELFHHARAVGSALAEKGYYRRPIDVLMKKHPNTRYMRGPIGGIRYGGTSSISANVGQGYGTMATPNGRLAHQPLA